MSIIIPGYGDSGPDHWQTHWQRFERDSIRLAPKSFDLPELDDWVAALDAAASRSSATPMLIAHSLGCLLVAHWASRGGRAQGAFLVAPPDPAARVFPKAAASFRDVPSTRLPFPALIVASADDPYASVAHVAERAEVWGAELVIAGTLGHINAASGIGAWEQGRVLLERFGEQLNRA